MLSRHRPSGRGWSLGRRGGRESTARLPSESQWASKRKGRKGEEAYDLDRPVPRTRAEELFLRVAPVDAKHLPLVLVPFSDGEVLMNVIASVSIER